MGQGTLRTVRLRNGSVEAEALVSVTMDALRDLLEEEPWSFVDAVEVAREPNHRPFGDAPRRLGLLDESGAMHGSIRAIILSAAEGDGIGMRLRSPLAETS